MVVFFTKESARGLINAGGKRYAFEIYPDRESQFLGLVKVDWKLKVLLGDSLTKFLSDKFLNVFDFHDKLSAFVQDKVNTTERSNEWLQNPLKICEFIKILQKEIEISGDCIKNFDIETGTVVVEITDSQLRTHKAHLKFSQYYQVEPIQIISLDLPLQKINSPESGLSQILSVSEFCQKFSELVNHFQEFWNKIAQLDSQCCVLDPANPTFKDVYRRIKLTDTLSVVLTFNPFFPQEKPQMKLLGSNFDVNHYQNILQSNLEKDVWDPDEDLVYNLSNILEITIPEKMFTEVEEPTELTDTGECAICFCWRLRDEIPSEVCENPSCRSMYHSTCLFKYLSTLPRNRSFFCKIQGECPSCDDVITCAVPKLI